ncbi:hypothetical protein D0Y65_000810 [Glycine soja]|uniref:Uncharacterized protein n=1 Tax=Glycine soja TaxID=3848 RepID=A0A445M084_GLYSO|nr:hypothetical protein D0Y65_000810 [Glycine soja]
MLQRRIRQRGGDRSGSDQAKIGESGKGLVFGFGAMFGILMSLGAQCHKTGHHHPWSCHTKARTKEIAEGAAKDDATIANN